MWLTPIRVAFACMYIVFHVFIETCTQTVQWLIRSIKDKMYALIRGCQLENTGGINCYYLYGLCLAIRCSMLLHVSRQTDSRNLTLIICMEN